jgi:hypothetical protein
VEEIVGPTEWEIPDDAKGLTREPVRDGVVLDDFDVRPAAAKSSRQSRIQLDRDHPASDPGELGGQATSACTEVNNKVVRTDGGVSDDFGGESLCAEEVLITRSRQPRVWCASACHGRTGW